MCSLEVVAPPPARAKVLSLFQHSGCSLGVVVLLALFGLGDSFRYKKLTKEMEDTNTRRSPNTRRSRTGDPAAVELARQHGGGGGQAAPEASELGAAVGNLGNLPVV